MSQKYQKIKIAIRFCQRIYRKSLNTVNRKFVRLLKTIFGNSRRQEPANDGFVLPTVVLVSLVVVLLTTAILFRAFDRAKNASNVRVNQTVVNAAMPAIDRAKAKLQQLLNDPGLPRSTPTDTALYTIIKNPNTGVINTAYNFGDETPLELAFDINGDGTIESGVNSSTSVYTLESDESLNTAWKFPVDTDNNGKFDTFTLYAIYFRSPSRVTATTTTDTGTVFNRPRSPLDARTPPMNQAESNSTCATAAGTSAGLVGDSSWYNTGGNLSKSFYVYTANVPINSLSGLSANNYETKANRGFSSLEYEQDRFLIPVGNNAVWFEHDLEITPGKSLYLNGAIHTNGNLLVGATYTKTLQPIYFRQVSSPFSCYYSQQNAKVTVGGNIATAGIAQSTDGSNPLIVDLYQGQGIKGILTSGNANPPTVTPNVAGVTTHKSTTATGGSTVAFNDAAYNSRISLMQSTAIALCTSCATATTASGVSTAFGAVSSYPSTLINTVQGAINDALQANTLSSGDAAGANSIVAAQVQLYFQQRTRRVPFAEVSQSIPTDTQSRTCLDGTVYTSSNIFTTVVDVPLEWRDISSTNTGLTLNLGELEATQPQQLAAADIEYYAGDRVSTGNNLPAYWKDTTQSGSPYVTGTSTQVVDFSSSSYTKWNPYPTTASALSSERTRTTQIQPQLDLGVTDRGEFWEQYAAIDPATTSLANVGGMRIVTGAGMYVDDNGITNDTPTFPRTVNQPLYPGQPKYYSFLPNPKLDTTASTTTPFVNIPFVNSSCVLPCTNSQPGTMPVSPPLSSTEPDIYVWRDTMPMTSPVSGASNTGDLLMRATAVYHYAYKYPNNTGAAQNPIACISSYYDPTNSTTAQNLYTLPWQNTNSWVATTTNGKSNNGIVYDFPGRSTFTGSVITALKRQARLVFPNGRVANQPLRTAMQKYETDGSFTNFSYADYSALDTALCSWAIFNNSATTDSTNIAHGKIKESTFLDAREVKSLQHLADYQNIGSSGKQGQYTLTLEQRQPLEIRATDIDATYLASTTIGSPSMNEYLLPNSGIIYATRDDALTDFSYATIDSTNTTLESTDTTVNTLSSTDFQLDPTRRPNAIRLINTNGAYGTTLARNGTNSSTYNPNEKGLILVTNLPAYVKGNFNLHRLSSKTTQISEFGTGSDITIYNNSSGSGSSLLYGWYTNGQTTTSTASADFACRQSRPGCTPSDGIGDLWRPATILADAITLLSDGFKDGVRYDGDFDLNRNYFSIPPANSSPDLKTYPNGLVNNLVTNVTWTTTGTPTATAKASSYFGNGVTPIQRRTTFNEYLMESCNDIVVNCDNSNPSKWTTDTNGSVYASTLIGSNVSTSPPASGTTATAPATTPVNMIGFIRRVAFERYTAANYTQNDANSPHQIGDLILRNNANIATPANGGLPVPLGIDSTHTVVQAYYGNSYTPNTPSTGLWFRTTKTTTNTATANPTTNSTIQYASGSGNYLALLSNTSGSSVYSISVQSQPQLAPITQIFTDEITTLLAANNTSSSTESNEQYQSNWVQASTGTTTFNAALAGGNSPSRVEEQAAGLQAFTRFLEDWYKLGNSGNSVYNADITGSFIEFKRSSYATAPLAGILTATANTTGTTTTNLSFFGLPNTTYSTSNGSPAGTLPYYGAPGRQWGFDVGLLSQLPDFFAQRFTVPPSAPPTEYFREVNSDDAWVEALLCAKQPTSTVTSGTKPTYSAFAVPASYLPTNCPSSSYP